MTSSLVGSEMCIRDSSFSSSFHQVPMSSLFDNLLFWVLPDNLQGAVAVSYTHLTLPTICSV
eukprot:1171961-Prorocentrum_lima.AAC.1